MGKKQRKKVIINKESDKKYRHSVYINLPVPQPSIVKEIQDDGAIQRYFESCERIAKLESETILAAVKAKYSVLWKVLLILSVFLILLLSLILSDKVKVSWNGKSYESEKTHQSK